MGITQGTTKVFGLFLCGVTAFLGASGLWASQAIAQCNPIPGASGPDAVSVLFPWSSTVGAFGRVNGIQAYFAEGGVCNVGTEGLPGDLNTNHHPMMTQNLYRLSDVGFEQIGMSWVKHDDWTRPLGPNSTCGSLTSCIQCEYAVPECCDLPQNPQNPGCLTQVPRTLGVGCSDIYNACLNGEQSELGPRSQINPATGAWPTWGSEEDRCDASGSDAAIACRLQVKAVEVEGEFAYSLFFLEQQMITPDEWDETPETLLEMKNNNVSYNEVTVGNCDSNLCSGLVEQYNCNVYRSCNPPAPSPDACVHPLAASSGSCQSPAIRAWQDSDPSVVETDIQVLNDGLFILAAKATLIGSGWWSYEYALYNMNSDRSAGAFRVALPSDMCEAELQDIRDTAGFHDVDYHSGEIWDGTDWMPPTVVSGSITWATTPYATNQNANALRWGTLYNFRFRSLRTPDYASSVRIDLFKTGTPPYVTRVSVAPGESPLRACCTGGTCIVTTPCDCYALGGEVFPKHTCVGVYCALAPVPGP